MKQLSGIDASFLYMETPETPMHVAGLTLYEAPRGLAGSFHDHFRAFLETRLHLIPIFSKKLARTVLDLDHPGWVEAYDLDLDHHIRHAVLPKPGRFDQLEAMVADLHAVPLDRARPLWQFTVIEGLADGRLALYSKVHHAAVDGGAGMVITKALYDLTETPREVDPPPRRLPRPPKPTLEQRALTGLSDLMTSLVRQHLNALAAGAQMMTAAAGLLLPGAAADEDRAAGPQDKGPPSLPSLVAPRTPFNVTITGQRSYAARSVPLDQVKLVTRATGAKVNDVVMAICAGALRRYLLDKRKLPKTPLVAFVPISLREAGNTEINNQVFGMTASLATDIADPLERLQAIRKAAGTSKAIAGATKGAAPKDFTLLGAPLLLPGLMQLLGRSGLADVVPMGVNVTISNTMGPPVPLYCAGAKVLALYPVSIPVHGVGLNLTVQSYLGKLDFGLTACRKAVPDIGRLADLLQAAMDELADAVRARDQAGEAAQAAAAPAAEGRGAAPAAKPRSAKARAAAKAEATEPVTAKLPKTRAPEAKASEAKVPKAGPAAAKPAKAGAKAAAGRTGLGAVRAVR